MLFRSLQCKHLSATVFPFPPPPSPPSLTLTFVIHAGNDTEFTDDDITAVSTEFSDDTSGISECSDDESEVPQSSAVPLFPESRVTTDEFNVAFMSVLQRHNLTYASQTDILKLLSIVLPAPSHVPSSAQTLTSKFVNYKNEVIVQHFCGSCCGPLQSSVPCLKPECVEAHQQRTVFVRIPLSVQLQERFQGMPSIVLYAKHPFSSVTIVFCSAVQCHA